MLCCKALPYEHTVCGFASRLRAYLGIGAKGSNAVHAAQSVVLNTNAIPYCLFRLKKRGRTNGGPLPHACLKVAFVDAMWLLMPRR